MFPSDRVNPLYFIELDQIHAIKWYWRASPFNRDLI